MVITRIPVTRGQAEPALTCPHPRITRGQAKPVPTCPNSRFSSGRRDLNPRPQPWQGCALPTELLPQFRGRLVHGVHETLATRLQTFVLPSGAKGDRTPDLLNAIQALYQLSYRPSLSAGLPKLDCAADLYPILHPAKKSAIYPARQEPRRIPGGISKVKKYRRRLGLDIVPPAGILHRNPTVCVGAVIHTTSAPRKRRLIHI